MCWVVLDGRGGKHLLRFIYVRLQKDVWYVQYKRLLDRHGTLCEMDFYGN